MVKDNPNLSPPPPRREPPAPPTKERIANMTKALGLTHDALAPLDREDRVRVLKAVIILLSLEGQLQ
jgi:hypothetical protein